MGKDTSKIVEELGLCKDFTSFYQENKEYMEKLDEIFKADLLDPSVFFLG